MKSKKKTEYDRLERLMRKNIDKRQKHDETSAQYKKHAVWFINYLKAHRITPQMVEKAPIQCIQQYADYLSSGGKGKILAAATVKTYIAYICGYYGLSMNQIKRKKCSILESKKIQKGMDKEKQKKVNIQGQKDAEDPRYQRLLEFQKRAGIRREELENLTLSNLEKDENDIVCLTVTRGKGGKFQMQTLLPEDVDFISEYFGSSSNSTDAIFSKKEVDNDIDLHTIRAAHAREGYEYYKNLIQDNPEEKVKLQARLLDRFFQYNKSYALTKDGEKKEWKLKKYIKDMTGITFIGSAENQSKQLDAYLKAVKEGVEPKEANLNPKNVSGQYKIRGDSKIVADAFGREHIYDRLALMAVSVFHLAHWRNDVTVRHYMLAP